MQSKQLFAEMSAKAQPIVGLDVVRFIAALSVMLNHLGVTWWRPDIGSPFGEHYRSGLKPLYEFLRWGGLGVDVFLCCPALSLPIQRIHELWGSSFRVASSAFILLLGFAPL